MLEVKAHSNKDLDHKVVKDLEVHPAEDHLVEDHPEEDLALVEDLEDQEVDQEAEEEDPQDKAASMMDMIKSNHSTPINSFI